MAVTLQQPSPQLGCDWVSAVFWAWPSLSKMLTALSPEKPGIAFAWSGASATQEEHRNAWSISKRHDYRSRP